MHCSKGSINEMKAEKKLKLEPTTQADHTGDAILRLTSDLKVVETKMKVIFVVITCLMLKVARYLNSFLFYLGSSVLSRILFNIN